MTPILKRNMRMRADRPKMTIAAVAAKNRLSDRTGPRASSVPRSRLTRLQADRNAKIAAARLNGATIRELARQYAVSFQRISYILRREIVFAALGDEDELREVVALRAR